MNKKQKKMARRIAVGGGLFLLGLILKNVIPYAGEVLGMLSARVRVASVLIRY